MARAVAILAITLPLLPLATGMDNVEDLESFALEAQVLDEAGWKDFLETASHSATSSKDEARRETLNAKVDQDRSTSISVSDEFARKLEKQKGVIGLREKAAKLRSDLVKEKAATADKKKAVPSAAASQTSPEQPSL